MAGNRNSGRTVDDLMREVIARAEKAVIDKWTPIIEEQFKHGTEPKDMKGGLGEIVRISPKGS